MDQKETDRISQLIFQKLKIAYEPQNDTYIQIGKPILGEVIELESIENYSFEEKESKELYEPKGFEISGYVKIKLIFAPSNQTPPRNINNREYFKFHLSRLSIKYNYDKEEFELCDNLEVSYIEKADIY